MKAVVVELDELISRIKADHKIQKKLEEPLSINFFAGTSTAGVDGQFVFFQVLIDCLLHLPSSPTDKKELIYSCKKHYEDNHTELSNIRDFRKNYSPNNALWWYTRESFFYKILNGALRSQNIHMIFLFRSIISDIHNQLKNDRIKGRTRVYRCQMISRDELQSLKQGRGQYISINSFFSTSISYDTAMSFLIGQKATPDLEPVLFEIEVSSETINAKPFADISKYSDFPEEAEILFMLGSIFRLNKISRSTDDQVWIIQMTLCGDDEHDLKQVLMYMKHQLGSGETNLRTLGKVLCKMGKFNLAEQYFIRLLNELPSTDPLLGNLYEDLGEVASQLGEFNKSIQWYQKALTLKNPNQNETSSSTRKFFRSSYTAIRTPKDSISLPETD